jgi:hypothetical protein
MDVGGSIGLGGAGSPSAPAPALITGGASPPPSGQAAAPGAPKGPAATAVAGSV